MQFEALCVERRVFGAYAARSLGVGVLGSVSMPIGSTDDSMVKVASETVSSAQFYDRFFGLVEVFLPKPKEEKKAPHAPQQPKPELGVPEPAPVKAEVVVPAAVPVIVPEPAVAPVSEPVVPPAAVEPVLPAEVPVTVPAVVAPVTPVVEPAAEPAITPAPAAAEPSTVQ